MTAERKQKILDALKAGHPIRRYWKGHNRSGYLSHKLEGVERLRKTECLVLLRDRVIEIDRSSPGNFKSYKLKEST